MSRLDNCHNQIVSTLTKAGWQIEPRSPRFSWDGRLIVIDIEARKQSNGTSASIMLVEVKCLADPEGATTALYNAFGQYMLYRAVLAELGNLTPLYLAVPFDTFTTQSDLAVMRLIRENQVKMIIIDLEQEEIVRWIE